MISNIQVFCILNKSCVTCQSILENGRRHHLHKRRDSHHRQLHLRMLLQQLLQNEADCQLFLIFSTRATHLPPAAQQRAQSKVLLKFSVLIYLQCLPFNQLIIIFLSSVTQHFQVPRKKRKKFHLEVHRSFPVSSFHSDIFDCGSHRVLSFDFIESDDLVARISFFASGVQIRSGVTCSPSSAGRR